MTEQRKALLMAEIFMLNGKPHFVHPVDKKMYPADPSTKAGQRIEVPYLMWKTVQPVDWTQGSVDDGHL